MHVKKYRAKTMQQALALVRRDLGPGASVLRTREVRGGSLWQWIGGSRLIEVMASKGLSVPSRLPPRRDVVETLARAIRPAADDAPRAPGLMQRTLSRPPSSPLQSQIVHSELRIDDLCHHAAGDTARDLGDAQFRLFTDLIDADVSEQMAREWVERVRRVAREEELRDVTRLKARLAQLIEREIPVSGPIRLSSSRRHLVALVGPTGVGKTTTIAKLAAIYRLREKRRVGLITVDTYRIAAVEQLRTYADIIDLPMEIVSTPREMHQALSRMSDLDLILMDTAGRSPRDEVKIQELKSILVEASPDEVHLVLSSAASASTLTKTAAQFANVGTTALLLTKLDEATSLGNVLPVARESRLPLSYLTHGQNVPDDIAPADASRLARSILGMDAIAVGS